MAVIDHCARQERGNDFFVTMLALIFPRFTHAEGDKKERQHCENYILPRIGEIGRPDQCARAGLLGDWRPVLGGRNPCGLGQSR
jgi:hypothetical protein